VPTAAALDDLITYSSNGCKRPDPGPDVRTDPWHGYKRICPSAKLRQYPLRGCWINHGRLTGPNPGSDASHGDQVAVCTHPTGI
jgi:hypothetical protein